MGHAEETIEMERKLRAAVYVGVGHDSFPEDCVPHKVSRQLQQTTDIIGVLVIALQCYVVLHAATWPRTEQHEAIEREKQASQTQQTFCAAAPSPSGASHHPYFLLLLSTPSGCHAEPCYPQPAS